MNSNQHQKKETLALWNANIKHKNTEQSSIIFCDRVDYHLNHLFFYNKDNPVFKVWLKKDYKNIQQALKDVGIYSNLSERRNGK
jgi:hypothetical protein